MGRERGWAGNQLAGLNERTVSTRVGMRMVLGRDGKGIGREWAGNGQEKVI